MKILEAHTRVFVDADALDPTIAFYQALLGGEQTTRFVYPEAGLDLAAGTSPRLQTNRKSASITSTFS